jgi:hypothetical protein
MRSITDAAFVVSVHYEDPNNPGHINLKWKGNHEISDFNLDSLGTVVDWRTETENTGWAIVRSCQLLNDSIVAPVSQFGHRILPSSVSPGDLIPLRPEAKDGGPGTGPHHALSSERATRIAAQQGHLARIFWRSFRV